MLPKYKFNSQINFLLFLMNNDHKNSLTTVFRSWFWVVIFSIAFAWVECAVVIYLREIYYGGSFYFPIHIEWQNGIYVSNRLMRVEFGREIATIIMLAAIGLSVGKNNMQRFSYFIISFGIWDIFYYIWLRILTGWPKSLMTWDLLFFVPLPWVGPVITPVLISIMMICSGTVIIYFNEIGYELKFRWYDWFIELFCALLIIIAFCWDWKNIMRVPGEIFYDGIPDYFAWWLYLPAFIFSVIYFIIRLTSILQKQKINIKELK